MVGAIFSFSFYSLSPLVPLFFFFLFLAVFLEPGVKRRSSVSPKSEARVRRSSSSERGRSSPGRKIQAKALSWREAEQRKQCYF